MNLRDRLRLMRAAGTRQKPAAERHDAEAARPGNPEAAAPPAGSESPRGPGTETGEAPVQLPGTHITGRLLPTAVGPVFCVETFYPAHFRRGQVPLNAGFGVAGRGWQRVGRHPAWATFDPTRAIYFDTETTGLERGAGTVIFLAGVGRFVAGGFRLRQFFLRDYPEEPAFVAALLAEFADARAVVSFNGKSFDWPLLATRAVLQRMRTPELPHLDLLYPARRIWRDTAASFRLTDLEAVILGEGRSDDVPSHQIPQLYFDYLRSGAAAPLAGVFHHNQLDILSLAALAGYMGQAAAEPLTAAPAGRPLAATELLALGRILLEDGEHLEAVEALEAALDRGLPGFPRRQARRLLALAYKRLQRFDQALPLWEALAQEESHGREAYIELAKYYEHRVRDYARARAVTLTALERLQRERLLTGLGRGIDPRRERELQAIQHRLARLESKLARQEGPIPEGSTGNREGGAGIG